MVSRMVRWRVRFDEISYWVAGYFKVLVSSRFHASLNKLLVVNAYVVKMVLT